MKNRLMPVIFEISENETLSNMDKEKMYRVFQEICFKFRVLCFCCFRNDDICCSVLIGEDSERVLRKIIGEFNEKMDKEDNGYSMYLPVIRDGVVFKRPAFYPFGDLIVSK